MAPDEGAAFNRAFERAAKTAPLFTLCVDPLSVHAPEDSARAGVTPAQTSVLIFGLAIAGATLILTPLTFLTFAALCGGILFAALILLRYAAAVTPVRIADVEPHGALPVYSILCPVYREAAALPGLVAALDRLKYPRALFDVIILVEADDDETRGVAAAAAARHAWLRVAVAPQDGPRTKPKAMNAGLALARGTLLTVYDAEDRPHPDQLRAAVAAFERGGDDLACVQAPLRIYNARDSWMAGQFALEYAVQFGRLLPFFVRLGWPILLGGTSNHFRTADLRAAHGWDAYNVTEDADLGLRLARRGLRTGLITPPTYEEAPITARAWLRQRTRWIKGHLMTWLVHMRAPGRMLRDLGARRFIGAQLTLAGGVVSSFAHGWLVLGAAWFLASGGDWRAVLLPAGLGYAAALACALRAAIDLKQWRFVLRGLLAPLYWPLQTVAAFLALWELFRAPFVWAKTEHGLTRATAPEIGHASAKTLNNAFE